MLSVALATHNGERWVGPLLESLARQTRLPDELVVWDDVSHDSTPALLEAFARGAPFPVRIERGTARAGATDAFLRAARLCRGDIVAYCDQDDVWLEHKLELCASALDPPEIQLAMHSVRVVDAGLREIVPRWPLIDATRVVPRLGLTGLGMDAPGMAMVFRRGLLDVADPARRPRSRYGGERRMLHDEWVLFMAGVLGSVQLIAEPLVLYRQHGGNHAGCTARDRRKRLEPAIDDYRAAAAHCMGCADYLAATVHHDESVTARMADGARHYGHAAANWRRRVDLYRAPDRLTRARVLRRLIAARAYCPRSRGGFGGAALGKDAVGGVAIRLRGPAAPA